MGEKKSEKKGDWLAQLEETTLKAMGLAQAASAPPAEKPPEDIQKIARTAEKDLKRPLTGEEFARTTAEHFHRTPQGLADEHVAPKIPHWYQSYLADRRGKIEKHIQKTAQTLARLDAKKTRGTSVEQKKLALKKQMERLTQALTQLNREQQNAAAGPKTPAANASDLEEVFYEEKDWLAQSGGPADLSDDEQKRLLRARAIVREIRENLNRAELQTEAKRQLTQWLQTLEGSATNPLALNRELSVREASLRDDIENDQDAIAKHLESFAKGHLSAGDLKNELSIHHARIEQHRVQLKELIERKKAPDRKTTEPSQTPLDWAQLNASVRARISNEKTMVPIAPILDEIETRITREKNPLRMDADEYKPLLKTLLEQTNTPAGDDLVQTGYGAILASLQRVRKNLLREREKTGLTQTEIKKAFSAGNGTSEKTVTQLENTYRSLAQINQMLEMLEHTEERLTQSIKIKMRPSGVPAKQPAQIPADGVPESHTPPATLSLLDRLLGRRPAASRAKRAAELADAHARPRMETPARIMEMHAKTQLLQKELELEKTRRELAETERNVEREERTREKAQMEKTEIQKRDREKQAAEQKQKEAERVAEQKKQEEALAAERAKQAVLQKEKDDAVRRETEKEKRLAEIEKKLAAIETETQKRLDTKKIQKTAQTHSKALLAKALEQVANVMLTQHQAPETGSSRVMERLGDEGRVLDFEHEHLKRLRNEQQNAARENIVNENDYKKRLGELSEQMALVQAKNTSLGNERKNLETQLAQASQIYSRMQTLQTEAEKRLETQVAAPEFTQVANWVSDLAKSGRIKPVSALDLQTNPETLGQTVNQANEVLANMQNQNHEIMRVLQQQFLQGQIAPDQFRDRVIANQKPLRETEVKIKALEEKQKQVKHSIERLSVIEQQALSHIDNTTVWNAATGKLAENFTQLLDFGKPDQLPTQAQKLINQRRREIAGRKELVQNEIQKTKTLYQLNKIGDSELEKRLFDYYSEYEELNKTEELLSLAEANAKSPALLNQFLSGLRQGPPATTPKTVTAFETKKVDAKPDAEEEETEDEKTQTIRAGLANTGRGMQRPSGIRITPTDKPQPPTGPSPAPYDPRLFENPPIGRPSTTAPPREPTRTPVENKYADAKTEPRATPNAPTFGPRPENTLTKNPIENTGSTQAPPESPIPPLQTPSPQWTPINRPPSAQGSPFTNPNTQGPIPQTPAYTPPLPQSNSNAPPKNIPNEPNATTPSLPPQPPYYGLVPPQPQVIERIIEQRPATPQRIVVESDPVKLDESSLAKMTDAMERTIKKMGEHVETERRIVERLSPEPGDTGPRVKYEKPKIDMGKGVVAGMVKESEITSTEKEIGQLNLTTALDQIVEVVNKYKIVSSSDLAKYLRITPAQLQNYCDILEESKLIRIEYPAFGPWKIVAVSPDEKKNR